MFDVTIEEVAMLPVPVTVKWQDGSKETFQLPRLGTEDFIPCLAEETKRRRAADQAAIAKVRLAPRERIAAEKAAAMDEATIPDLALRVQQPSGIKAVIYASMQKAGMLPEKQDKLFSVLPAYIRVNLAAVLSTLFQPAPLVSQPDLAASPPAPSGDTPANGGASGSDPFESDSATTDSSEAATATTGSLTV